MLTENLYVNGKRVIDILLGRRDAKVLLSGNKSYVVVPYGALVWQSPGW